MNPLSRLTFVDGVWFDSNTYTSDYTFKLVWHIKLVCDVRRSCLRDLPCNKVSDLSCSKFHLKLSSLPIRWVPFVMQCMNPPGRLTFVDGVWFDSNTYTSDYTFKLVWHIKLACDVHRSRLRDLPCNKLATCHVTSFTLNF
jgi:hypothetical protein